MALHLQQLAQKEDMTLEELIGDMLKRYDV